MSGNATRVCKRCGAVGVPGWNCENCDNSDLPPLLKYPTSATEFVNLCKQLRALGAIKVAHGDCSAEFVPVTAAYVQPGAGQRRQEERPPTPEEANEMRRRRELGCE